MRVVNTDALSHWNKSTEKYFQNTEKENKKKYLESCLQKCCHLSSFIVSVYGLLGIEAEATIKSIAGHLATKCKHPYS